MRSPRLIGIVSVLLSVLCFYFGTLPIRWAKEYGELSGPDFVFARFAVGSIVICLLCILQGRFPRPDRPVLLVSRALFHFVAAWLYYLAIEKSNAALGNVLHMTYPLFAAVILLIAGKSVSPLMDIVLSAVSVGGIALTCDLAGSNTAIMLGLSSGLCGAFSVILLSVTRKGNSTLDVFFYTFIGGFLLTILFARPVVIVHSAIEIWLLLLSATLGVAGQFLFTYGAAYISAVESGILSCIRIPLVLLGAVVGLETVPVTSRAWFGAILVFLMNIIVIRQKKRSLPLDDRDLS